MKKIIYGLLLVILIGITSIYYETYGTYKNYQKLSSSEQQWIQNTSPIRYMLIKDLIFWDKSL